MQKELNTPDPQPVNLDDLNLQDIETLGESDTYGLPEGTASGSVGRGCGSCSYCPAGTTNSK